MLRFFWEIIRKSNEEGRAFTYLHLAVTDVWGQLHTFGADLGSIILRYMSLSAIVKGNLNLYEADW